MATTLDKALLNEKNSSSSQEELLNAQEIPKNETNATLESYATALLTVQRLIKESNARDLPSLERYIQQHKTKIPKEVKSILEREIKEIAKYPSFNSNESNIITTLIQQVQQNIEDVKVLKTIDIPTTQASKLEIPSKTPDKALESIEEKRLPTINPIKEVLLQSLRKQQDNKAFIALDDKIPKDISLQEEDLSRLIQVISQIEKFSQGQEKADLRVIKDSSDVEPDKSLQYTVDSELNNQTQHTIESLDLRRVEYDDQGLGEEIITVTEKNISPQQNVKSPEEEKNSWQDTTSDNQDIEQENESRRQQLYNVSVAFDIEKDKKEEKNLIHGSDSIGERMSPETLEHLIHEEDTKQAGEDMVHAGVIVISPCDNGNNQSPDKTTNVEEKKEVNIER